MCIRDRSEEEQFEAYKKTAVMMDGKEVIIRTLDVGGDKNIPCLLYTSDVYKRQAVNLYNLVLSV